jgi:hypothetical protein
MSASSGFPALYEAAHKAGHAAAVGSSPTPMVVSGMGKSYYVSEGVCGFAWIVVKPGNSPFANWLKKTGKGDKAYGGGVDIWVGDYGQSLDRKSAYASAFAKVLSEAGIRAYSNSRMD